MRVWMKACGRILTIEVELYVVVVVAVVVVKREGVGTLWCIPLAHPAPLIPAAAAAAAEAQCWPCCI